MDLDLDGRQDLLSGSWPGEIFWFQRMPDNTFAAAKELKNAAQESVNIGQAASVNTVDWDNDGDMDLLIGTIDGKVHWVPNLDPAEVKFGEARRINLHDSRKRISDAAPVAADWDGDGDLDLLLGAGDGSVHWFRNDGSRSSPVFAKSECLIPRSPLGWGNDQSRKPGDWGLRVRLDAKDWNNDGLLDLLLGDLCGGFEAKPDQTEAEIKEELVNVEALPRLRDEWSRAFQEYRQLGKGAGANTPASESQRDTLLAKVRLLKAKIAETQQVVMKYESQRQSHGFVWLITRKPQSEVSD